MSLSSDSSKASFFSGLFKNRFIKKAMAAPFIRNVAVLSGGTAISQVITVLSLPVLTRLYTPESFGLYAVFNALVMIPLSAVSLQYQQAIVLPEKDEDAGNILILALFIAVGVCAMILIILLMFGRYILLFFKSVAIQPFLLLAPVGLLAAGLIQVFDFWLIRHKRYKTISIIRLFQVMITVATQLIFVVSFQVGAMGLVGGFIAGQVAALSIQTVYIWKNHGVFILRNMNIDRMKILAVKYKKFPLYSSWMLIFDRLKAAMPVFFLAKFFGSEATGFYSMTIRILYMPLRLLGRAISKVLFQRVAEEQNSGGDIGLLVEKTFRIVGLMGVLYFIGILCGSHYFGFFLGQKWSIVGAYSRMLNPAFPFILAASTMSLVLVALNKQEFGAIWQVTSIVSLAVFLYISISFASIEAFFGMLMVNYLLMYSLYMYLIFRAAGARFSRAFYFWKRERE